MPPHRAQECLGVPVGFERWMYLTLMSFDRICDCYRDLGMAFSHLLRYIHLPQLDNMDKGLSAPCPPATTSCEVHGWAEEIPLLRMVFCWPFYLRCWSVDVMVTFDGLLMLFWKDLSSLTQISQMVQWAEMGWRPCIILVFQEIAWKYIHSMQSCRACRTEEVGLEGSRRGKEKKKTVVLSLSKLVCRYMHFLCCFQFLDRNHELLHGFWMFLATQWSCKRARSRM